MRKQSKVSGGDSSLMLASEDSEIRKQINTGALMAASPKREPTLDEQIEVFRRNAKQPPELPERIDKSPTSSDSQPL